MLRQCHFSRPFLELVIPPSDDIVSILRTCLDGLAPFCFVHPGVKVIPAHPKSLTQALNMDIVSTIRTAYETAADPKEIRAVVVTNPSNPLAQCYPREVIEAIMRFCEEKGLHYVSDEAYAPCQFGTGTPFISALEAGEGILDRSRIHVIWTASKAFGSSGVRIVSEQYK